MTFEKWFAESGHRDSIKPALMQAWNACAAKAELATLKSYREADVFLFRQKIARLESELAKAWEAGWIACREAAASMRKAPGDERSLGTRIRALQPPGGSRGCTGLPSEPAPKPTHEERARALMETWWAMPSQGSTKEQWLGMLAAAFAQVEAEAKPFFGIPNPKLCAVCGKSPCQSFIACAVRLSKTFYGIPRPHYIDLAVNRDVKIECAYQVGIVSNLPDLHPLPKFTVPNLASPLHVDRGEPESGGRATETQRLASCTCGAASCGSRLHSSWCDAA